MLITIPLFRNLRWRAKLTAFDSATVTLDKHFVKEYAVAVERSLSAFRKLGRPKPGNTFGTERYGNDLSTSEQVITVDDILVSHYAISDLDRILSHWICVLSLQLRWAVRLQKCTTKTCSAKLFWRQRNRLRHRSPVAQLSPTRRSPRRPVSTVVSITSKQFAPLTSRCLTKTSPKDAPRYAAVSVEVFDAIKYAKDATNNYLVLNRDFGHGGAGGIDGRAEMMNIDGVMVVKSRHIPTSNDTSNAAVFSKYRADFSNTALIMWCPQAVATVKMMDISMETERDVRRLEDFLVSKMFVGHGILRPEMAYVAKSA